MSGRARQAVLCLAALAACGGRQTSRGGGPVTVALAPTTPAALAYNQRPPAASSRPAPAGEVMDEVQRIAARLGRPELVADSRLDAAATELAQVALGGAPLVYGVIEFALQRHGIIEPSPQLVIASTGGDESLAASLAPRLEGLLGSMERARVGVGVARSERGRVLLLAFLPSSIETDPIPRRLELNSAVALRAQIAGDLAEPEVLVGRDDGEVTELALTDHGEGGFRAELPCLRAPGRMQVEISARDESGTVVLANFPVWCGADPPAAFRVAIDASDAAPVTSAAEAEERLAGLLNRDRARHGLPPLALAARVSDVARAHSREMRQTGVVSDISPTSGRVRDQITRLGITGEPAEANVARAYSVAEVEAGFMNQPRCRAAILSRTATHMGLGVALGQHTGGRRELFVTQVFVELAPRQGQAQRGR